MIAKHQNDRVSYAALDARSNALARGLESVGVRKGDRVGVMLGNSMEHAVVRIRQNRSMGRMLISCRQPTHCSNWAPFWYVHSLYVVTEYYLMNLLIQNRSRSIPHSTPIK